MKIIYLYHTNFTAEQAAIMQQLGVNVNEGYDKIEIERGDLYFTIEPYLTKWGYSDKKTVGTLYDKKELNEAHFLEFNGIEPIGYPQPESNWNTITYDVSENCDVCDIGKIQKEPFRIKKPPKIDKKMVSMEWVHDELFVTEKLFDLILQPLGFDYWPVLLYKKETVIPGWVQPKIPIIDARLALDHQPYETCPKCSRKKYRNQIEGLFPAFIKENVDFKFCKSIEYYGSGNSANRWLLIDQALRKKLIELGIKAQYRPVMK